jgi:phosphoglycolate phosphatase-like HAD superfamily hydrolase
MTAFRYRTVLCDVDGTLIDSNGAATNCCPLFSGHTSKDDAAESKPDPDIVQAALARVDARPESTVMVGDTPYDIEAARLAGVAAIALRCGGYWTDAELRGAIEIYDDPAALLARWRAMGSRSGPT